MNEREGFFGIFRDIYDVHKKDIKVIKSYESKFAEAYDILTEVYCGEIDEYIKYLSLCQGERILELACGSGRLTIPLAKKGYKITGVDISESMIEILKSKLSNRIKKNIQLIIDDVTTLEKVIGEFDLVILPATSIRLLDVDLLEFINNVGKYIKKGGYFIFDFRDSSKQEEELHISEMNARTYEKDGILNALFMQEECDLNTMKSKTNFYIDSFGENNERILGYFFMNLCTYKQMEEIAKRSDFSEHVIERYEVGKINAYNCILKK